jgi:hypothetical protein
MNENDTAPLPRKSDEAEIVYQRRLRKYIVKNAPAERRYYVRNGTPGTKGGRWIVPGLFMALGLFFAVNGYLLGADIRNINGPNGTQGEFMVEDLVKSSRDRAANEEPEFTPVVTIRNQAVVPLNSKPGDNHYAVGDMVTVRYTRQGKVVASFLKEDGKAADAPSRVLTAMGFVVILIGVLVGRYYRGAVDNDYVESEMKRLSA